MRRFLIIFAFVVLPLTVYFTVSHVTVSEAQCTGNVICIPPNSLVAGLATVIIQTVVPGFLGVQGDLEVYFGGLTQDFWAGMQPVMDWSFRQLSDWFDTLWYYNLLPQLQQMTRQLSTANVEQAFALGMFADAANVIRTRRTLDDLAIKDQREQRPSEKVCTAGSIMPALERATAFSDEYQAYGPLDKWWIAANQAGGEAAQGFAYYLADRWENNAPTASVGSTPVSNGGTYGYVKNWCKAAFNNGFAGCTQDARWAGEDVDVAGLVFAQDTIPLDLTQDPSPWRIKGDLDELVTNLAESFGKDPVTAGLAGKDGILASLSYRAKRQVVYDGLYAVISRRVPGGLRAESKGMPEVSDGGTDVIDLLKAMRAATGEDGNTGCGGTSSSPCPSPNPSRNEILRAMMTQRFQSGRFSLGQIDEPENNAREQVIDQALQLIQMNDQMELMDHYSVLLAAQISSEILQARGFTSASGGAPMGGAAAGAAAGAGAGAQ